MRRVLVIVAAAAVVPVLGACGGTTSGTATTSTSAVEVALWNPCTEIPDDLLRRVGVDPAKEESGIAGVHQSGWEICTWEGRQYFLTVYSSRRTVQEIREKPGNVGFRDVSIGGRPGLEYRVEGASMNLECDIIFDAEQGMVSLQVGNRASADNHEDPCMLVNNIAETMVPAFPA
ncbi:Protein of unknown function [Nocardia farcinica]|uniref:Protein of uncharacterized function (DUF3558) n=1 Tax=Nocardia farcinica TaxID=37329 RepID=A0A0H5PGB9_NOCFR|nr:DUF3558 domain-containing protein [Nocardia farcinica]AXK87365.1 DUF3558 domain-containing protein [Nocardia farcinica]PFW98242.1 hypothetical protein CJ469_06400 [Nocardia farcinica]PFW98775.1 hypothetical protein CJ468_06434 [Nocardia farcinica]CRY81556.1 Protein of uncharacterised function (DUF3558) [Nocardia farcinica]SIT14228.1 Protein of unknown function [Nocardia farcinica]